MHTDTTTYDLVLEFHDGDNSNDGDTFLEGLTARDLRDELADRFYATPTEAGSLDMEALIALVTGRNPSVEIYTWEN